MKITRTSPYSGKTNTLDLAVTMEQYYEWQNGKHAQDVFPGLNADEREFIISGIYPGEWEEMFGEEDEEDYEELEEGEFPF
jgi:hypothetical protein